MSAKSKIEWTDRTWNPVTGCTKVSRGCKNCYAERDWSRLSANPKTVYFGRRFGQVAAHPERLDQPLRWKRPSRIFVNSMSDLFHEEVDDLTVASVFAAMASAAHHHYQILTKRPARMRDLVARLPALARSVPAHLLPADGDIGPGRNVFLGVSAEDQATADARAVPLMLADTPRRWLSAEPLLGPIEIEPRWGLDWVVAGGESGPGARPMDPGWARSLRDRCIDLDIPFFFKQWGEHDERGKRVGKREAGRLLDGRTWDGYPPVEPDV